MIGVIFNIIFSYEFKNNLGAISNAYLKHKKITFVYVGDIMRFKLLDLNLILRICSRKWK